MSIEEQNRAWACLSSEAREYVKYTTPLTDDVTNTLNYLFGEHNILSRTEPEEMLMVGRKKVQEYYQEYQKAYNEEDDPCIKGRDYGKMASLHYFFGDKCLPDKEGVDCNELSKMLDEALEKETPESMKEWIESQEQPKPTDKVLSALEHYRTTATPSQKAADLSRLEKECLSGKEPIKIDAADSLIEMAKDEMNINKESNPKFNKGDKVVIIYGRHKGFRGIIQEYSEDDDTWAVIINGCDYPINFAEEWVEPYTEENENKRKKTKELSDDQQTENEETMEEKLAIGTHIKYNGDAYEIIGYDEVNYKVKVINPTDEDYATHIAYKAPFEILKEKELNLCELLKGCENTTFFSISVGKVFFKAIYDYDDTHKIRTVRKDTVGNEYNVNFHSDGRRNKDGLQDLYPSEDLLRKYPLDVYSAWMEWNESRKPKRWKANQYETYWFLDRRFIAKECTDNANSEFDRTNYENGNYFRTEEEAKQVAELIKETLIKFHEQNKQ